MHRLILQGLFLCLAAAPSLSAEELRTIASEKGDVTIHPIEHATFVLDGSGQRIAIDPVGGIGQSPAFEGVSIVLVTDIHGDHFDPETLQALAGQGATIVAPAAVAERMPAGLPAVLENGETTTLHGVGIEAIPMYNLTESRMHHPKGRGNGYVLDLSGLRIYVSGDTEDIPEMRNLENIDAAFVCMNLPYTMDVEAAADAVLDMQPRLVYPYHYRGKDGLSDVDRFAQLVESENSGIEVRQLDWYRE